MKRSFRALTGIAALLAATSASAKDLPNYNAFYEAKPGRSIVPPAAARLAGGFATSMDAQRGVPTFAWAVTPPSVFQSAHLALMTHEQAARAHLSKYAAMYGVSSSALDAAVVAHVHDTGRGGIVVTFHQTVSGIELYRNDVKVLMRRNHELVAISGSPHPSAVPNLHKGGAGTFKISAEKALTQALNDLFDLSLSPASVVDTKAEKANYRYFDLLPTHELKGKDLHFSDPARVKPVYFALPDRLVPGYFVELVAGDAASTDSDAYDYVIAADDGRVLYRENLKHYAAFNYRVYADPLASGGRPLDGPIVDFSPHPTGVPDGSQPAFAAPILITMDGFNKNPMNTFDPWMQAGATVTTGNNVDAYTDINAPDGFSAGDFRAGITGPNTFDLTYDLMQDPLASQNQGKAALIDIFYVTNWLDNWWYDSGFDEASGVAHQDNYGRGGIGGDPLHAEGEDSANTQKNNANMSAMVDGTSPRMQMYLWDGATTASLSANGASYAVGVASFGPASFNVPNTGLVLGVDATAPVNDGCEAFTNNVAGKIVLVDRGLCSFEQKVQNAQTQGAAGIVIANNAAGGPIAMGPASPPLNTNLPTLSVSQADGVTLKAALMNGAVTASMSETAAIRRDGTIDNSVVAHEWGHYLHHRLENASTQMCGGESEGWADFDALQMIVRPGDDLDGAFQVGIYDAISFGDSGYFGIRRFPYSVDMNKNPETFIDISDGQALPMNAPLNNVGAPNNSEVHNTGEIWASMMWEAFVALLKNSQKPNAPYTFAEARRRMSDYIVAGMKLSPTDPTITEQRDALLAAAGASDVNDMLLMAAAFAKRGAGTCAVSPPRNSTDLVGVVEDFGLKPEVSIVSVTVDDSVLSCDSDGILDASEKGNVTITIKNTGTAPLTKTIATVSSGLAGVSFPGGATATFGNIDPFATGTATVQIALDDSIMGAANLDLKVDVADPDACTKTQSTASTTKVNYDSVPASSASDDVESESPVWTVTSASGPTSIWSRQQPSPGNHVWNGADYGSSSDTALESPSLDVAGAGNLVLTFKYRHSFEQSGGTNWDGGVIEVSPDNGVTWNDISQYGSAPYGGKIGDTPNQAHNPLNGRQGLVGQSAGYPNMTTATIDMGASLAGKTVKVRFRVGSDEATGDAGLDVDDIAFQGITNTPFPSITPNAGSCADLPVADAGADQTVFSGDLVTLDGSKSKDPKMLPLTYAWSETSGPMVSLTAADMVKSTFTAPSVAMDTSLTFQVMVGDGKGSASAVTHVLVKPQSGSSSSSSGGAGGGSGAGGAMSSSSSGGPPTEVDGGCGCSTVGSSPATSLSPLVAVALLASRRRRSSAKRRASQA